MEIAGQHGLDVHRALARATGASLIVLTTQGCGACKAVLGALAEAPPIPGLTVWQVDAGQAAGLVDELEVFHLPALFLCRDGEFTPIHARPTPGALHDTLQAALRMPAEGHNPGRT